MSFKLFFGVVCYVSIVILSTAEDVKDEIDNENGIASGLKLIMKVVDQCNESIDTVNCLKLKALRFVDRAIHTESIPLVEGLTLVRSGEVDNNARRLKNEIVDENKVDELLVERISRFWNTHSLKVNMEKLVNGKLINAKNLFEGRGKHYKRLIGPMILGLLMKAAGLAVTMKGIALMAGAALMIANIALVLAGVIGLKKLFHSDEHEKVTYEIVRAPYIHHTHSYKSADSVKGGQPQGHGRWETNVNDMDMDSSSMTSQYYRSMDTAEPKNHPQMMAYQAQMPRHVQKVVVPRPTGTTQILVGTKK